MPDLDKYLAEVRAEAKADGTLGELRAYDRHFREKAKTIRRPVTLARVRKAAAKLRSFDVK